MPPSPGWRGQTGAATVAITGPIRSICPDGRRPRTPGSFRPDLFYRLNVVAVHLPPLRERRDDRALLIRHFVATKCREMGIPEKTVRTETVDALLRCPWPGNVRELENLIERLFVLSEGSVLTVDESEREIIAEALQQMDFNQTRAAEMLGTRRSGKRPP